MAPQRAAPALRAQEQLIGRLAEGRHHRDDAPALAQADVSFAMGAGTGSALSAADITLLSNDLGAVAAAMEGPGKKRR